MPSYVQKTTPVVVPVYPPVPGAPGAYPPPPEDPPDYPPTPPVPPPVPPPTARNLLYVKCGGGAKIVLPYKAAAEAVVKASTVCYEKAGSVSLTATHAWASVTGYTTCLSCNALPFCGYTSVTVTVNNIPACFSGSPAPGTYTLNRVGGSLGYGDTGCNYRNSAYSVFLELHVAGATIYAGSCPPWTIPAGSLVAQYYQPGVHSTVAPSGGGYSSGYVGVLPATKLYGQGNGDQCACSNTPPTYTIISWNP